MSETKLLKQIEDKSISREGLAEKIKNNSDLLPTILNGVSSPKASIRYGCANVLKDLSEERPEELYPYMDFFVQMLDSKYRILTWVAMGVIANLAEVDTEKKFDEIFDKYYSFLKNDYMVTVANVVGNSGKIAIAKPYLADKITNVLLKVEKIHTTPHLTTECRNVIIEKAIISLDSYFNQIENKEEVVSFVKRQLNNSRKTVKLRAEKFLKKNN